MAGIARRITIVVTVVAGLALCAVAANLSTAEGKTSVTPAKGEFTLVSVMIGKVKFWLPGTITVHQGDRIKLTLKNIVPGTENQHGFSIDAYKIKELVTRGAPKTIEFTADKPGVFRYYCHIHSAHVGGQLIVLKTAAR